MSESIKRGSIALRRSITGFMGQSNRVGDNGDLSSDSGGFGI